MFLAGSRLFFGDGLHPTDIRWQCLSPENGRILDKRFNAAAEEDDLLSRGIIVQGVFQSGKPAEIFRSVVATVSVDVVNHHMRLWFRSVKGCADDLMDTDVSGENHISIVGILGSKAPDIVHLTRATTIFREAADGTIVTGQILTALVFALHLAVEYLKQILVFHTTSL